ncbi:MAG: GNAT family N-acetyltransferase, partial [Pirellulales bacterium]|nr:GNAT family N-acetyltransferase [Pirellulales bacterium]
MTSRVSLRAMREADLPAARDLLLQLGYEIDAGELARRFSTVAAATAHEIVVAEQDGRLVGLLHVFERPALEKPPEALVQAVVVDDRLRGSGLGRQLM